MFFDSVIMINLWMRWNARVWWKAALQMLSIKRHVLSKMTPKLETLSDTGMLSETELIEPSCLRLAEYRQRSLQICLD